MMMMDGDYGREFDSIDSSYCDEWIKTQDLLKAKLIQQDDFTWKLNSPNSNSPSNPNPNPSSSSSSNSNPNSKDEILKYIGGTDISFLKENPSIACAGIVILDIDTLKIVHEEFEIVKLNVPYIAGFLAFREAPILLGLLDRMKSSDNPFYPQLLMVDGNGTLHPRGFGLACHIGVLANIPTIGIGKTLHHVDGLTLTELKIKLQDPKNTKNDIIPLIGQSGKIWGSAMRPQPGSLRPIFISIGHKISLDSAVKFVKLSSKFRIPEPIRQADMRSKVFLQKHKGSTNFTNLMTPL